MVNRPSSLFPLSSSNLLQYTALTRDETPSTDIDWEYPGGNGQDYRQTPNSAKVPEIDNYPLFLKAIRDAIGPNKLLSIAVPGKLEDFIAFTPANGPKIWPSVDMVNIMSYDLMNRRNNVTMHHTSVVDSHTTLKAYAAIGLESSKMNLGFAFYAKWFTTDPTADCKTNPIGCKAAVMENADGSDNGKSGALTFEKSTMSAAPGNLKMSTDGTCGFDKGTKCPSGQCCSQYGNWYVPPCEFIRCIMIYLPLDVN